MDQNRDEPMVNANDGTDDEANRRLPLSEDEEKALELYEQLQKLRLEIAIINAQSGYRSDRENESGDDGEKSRNGLLDARAKYKLRNDAIEAVMIANPILKAVHNGTTASPVERDLLPFVEQRDQVAKSVAKQATDMEKIRDELVDVQSQTSRACRTNIGLASTMLELAEQVKSKKAVRQDDTDAQRELSRLDADVKSSRQRWRVIKGVASGIIAGSGVDWARDDQLRDIVLDPEDDG